MERISDILDRILARVSPKQRPEEQDLLRIAREILQEWGIPEPEDLWVDGETLCVGIADPLVRQELSARSGEWMREIRQRMGEPLIRKIQWTRRRRR